MSEDVPATADPVPAIHVGKPCPRLVYAWEGEVAALRAENERLRLALTEIETICIESAGDCRRRMGTRVGNALVTARAALKDHQP